VASLGEGYYLISFSRSICPLSTLKKSQTGILFLSRNDPNKRYKLAFSRHFENVAGTKKFGQPYRP
jgi:hypothetical protein